MPMSLINIYGREKDKNAVLGMLQKMEIMDITACDEIVMQTRQKQAELTEKASVGERTLEVLEFYCHEKKGIFASLAGKSELTRAELRTYEERVPKTAEVCEVILARTEAISEKKSRITQLRSEIEILEPWLTLDADLYEGGTKSVACKSGILGPGFEASDSLPMHIETVSTTAQESRVFVIYSRKFEEECEKALAQMGFRPHNITDNGIPDAVIAKKRGEIRQLEKENQKSENEIRGYAIYRRDIQFMTDYFRMNAEKYKAAEKVGEDGTVFIINGYVPSHAGGQVKDRLEAAFAVAVETAPADDDAPVILKNSRLAEPVESVVETFALPDTYEIDPTAVMSLFYYVFFGLMLSDAAYGLIITLGCGILLRRFRKMEQGMRKTLRMFMYCGISTMFWGVMFGSYFGDAIAVVSGTFFGRAVTIPPLWFEPVTDPMRMLMFSFLLGLIHLFTALGINLYLSIKAHNYIGALKDGVFWYMLVGGGIVYLFGVDMFVEIAGLTSKLAPPFTTIAAVTAILGAVGILLFSTTDRSPAKRLAKGAYSLYGVTGWLSDILSYSRLLALGLATGVIATVFNKMGTMLGGGVLGAVVFVIVFVLGHTLNIGVNLLGAYVHTNRLQYVEFFGKFYEGGGRAFEPFGTGTKYFKMKG